MSRWALLSINVFPVSKASIYYKLFVIRVWVFRVGKLRPVFLKLMLENSLEKTQTRRPHLPEFLIH